METLKIQIHKDPVVVIMVVGAEKVVLRYKSSPTARLKLMEKLMLVARNHLITVRVVERVGPSGYQRPELKVMVQLKQMEARLLRTDIVTMVEVGVEVVLHCSVRN